MRYRYVTLRVKRLMYLFEVITCWSDTYTVIFQIIDTGYWKLDRIYMASNMVGKQKNV